MAFTKFTQRQRLQQRVETVAEFTLMKDNVRRKESSVANVASAITLLKFVVDSQNSSRMIILMKQNQGANILKNRLTR
jgi:hypothetical protein